MMRTGALLVLLALAGCGGSDPPAPQPPVTPIRFALPAKIMVTVTPYASSAAALADESQVDWDDAPRARSITLAFAAKELREHLALVNVDAAVIDGLRAVQESAVIVMTRDQAAAATAAGIELPDLPAMMDPEAYVIDLRQHYLFIVGGSRTGALNGTYRWLESLGFTWDDPDETFVPERSGLLARQAWPRIEGSPQIGLRGFWIYGRTLPSEFALWMARNRLNVSAPAENNALQRKLSLQGWRGEHDLIQEEFSRPGLFEQHPEWFALIGGIRRPVAPTGNYFNPAFGNDGAAEHFATRIIERLRAGDLMGVDVLNVWPADDRFNPFDQSPEAHAIGNETDNLLKFYAVLARRLRDAHAARVLPHRVTLAGISYYQTMAPPTNAAIVAELATLDYLHVFYPITRSWSGPIAGNIATSDANRRLSDDLAAWSRIAPFRFGVVEYHNQSVYGGVTLTDHLYLAENHAWITQGRQGLYANMHALTSHPGPRRLTNAILSKLGWQEAAGPWALSRNALTELVTREYFERRYAQHAVEWRRIYELMAQSTDNAQELFGSNSLYWVLFQDLIWNPQMYPADDIVGFIPAYRAGGEQLLPAAFSGEVTQRARFRGLDASITLQAEAQVLINQVLALPMPATVRARIESDVAWFSATASRYRLMAATCDFMIDRHAGADAEPARQRMLDEIRNLENLPLLHDTVSPVDQAGFLALHRQRAGP